MVNNIPNYYNVQLFMDFHHSTIDGPKWPIHVSYHDKQSWSSKIYDIVKIYNHNVYGSMTILINRETYESYSFAKSTRK